MANSNVVIITANLGGDPEMRYLDSGVAVTNFSLPVDIGWGDKKAVEWVRVSVFGKKAEQCNMHLRKGSLVEVNGKLEKTFVNDKGSATIQIKAIDIVFLANYGSQNGKEDFEF